MSITSAMPNPESNGSDRPPVALIAGPTAGGKSAVALELAEQTDGVLINADASQVYADLRILTARPDPSDLERAPHRLFGHIDGAEACSAARWASEAKAAIADVHAQNRLPILVGGTGLYLDTLLHGIAPVPDIDPQVRAAVRALDAAESYPLLQREDPESAARLKPGDTARIARALEVVRATGTPLGTWQQRRSGGLIGQATFHGGIVLRPREELASRAERRLGQMLSGGALAEVEALHARGLSAELPVMRALGVRELIAVLEGDIAHEEAGRAILSATLAYQKRQLTWGRNRQRGWTPIDPDRTISLLQLAVIG